MTQLLEGPRRQFSLPAQKLRRLCGVEIQLNAYGNSSIASNETGSMKVNIAVAQERGSAAVPSHSVRKPLGQRTVFSERHDCILLNEIGPYCRAKSFFDHHGVQFSCARAGRRANISVYSFGIKCHLSTPGTQSTFFSVDMTDFEGTNRRLRVFLAFRHVLSIVTRDHCSVKDEAAIRHKQ